MPKTAILFPGQGAQYAGMCSSVVEQSPIARDLFTQAQGILGYDLLDVCLNGPEEKLNSTQLSQPAIFVASLAGLEILKQTEPDAITETVLTAGLSLGEYTALVFAGALSFEEGLRLVQKRGEAMQASADATPSGMVSALLLDPEQVSSVVQEAGAAGRIWTANYLCPGNTVLSGESAAINLAVSLIEQKGGKPIRLSVAGAFHTDIMKPADQILAEALSKVTLTPPRIPVVSNVDALPHTDPSEIRELLVQQVLRPVRWEDGVKKLLELGVERYYEVGPGKVLAGLMKRIARKSDFRNITV